MTNAPEAAGVPSASPETLLAALRADAGGRVAGAAAGTMDEAPDVSGLVAARASAVLAAWTGARLHAGAPGLLRTDDPDLALLAGDWCFAYALRQLAAGGDLEAIGVLAGAIGDCALLLGPEAPSARRLAEIWNVVSGVLRAT